MKTAIHSMDPVRFAREAEFEKPLNERRVRYRELTLGPKLRPKE